MLKNSGKWLLKILAVLLVMGVLALASLMMLSRAQVGQTAQQGTVVVLVPPDRVYVGEVASIKLVANNAANLAGFQSTVGFDPNAFRFAGVTVEAGLEQSGRGVLPLGPARRDGAVVLGAATCPVADCSSPANPGQQPGRGINGAVELATIQLFAQAPGQYALTLDGVQLVDPEGNVLPAGTANASLNVVTR